ncbi:MEKHLA domain-containing protein [Epibacterium ulvae]|uniref:MEKHLA domain-containing protein n=1 Tax=Epibacterium ulvae TaxID=1156985 RepID=UPI001BFC0F01|nr:MEKHLA domain-containing protein [Epibacterium ulvae]MBT8155233.1 MEKHLA domain-containing protein [Epibacterium ulvae]
MQEPGPDNDYQSAHTQLLTTSYIQLMGRALYRYGQPQALYHAPFPILSHSTDADPILTYANLAAQKLWQLGWDELTQMPSRLTAEPQHRDARAAMFDRMRQQGFVDDYSGIRVTATGKRFEIRNAVIWTLRDASGEKQGEAATFSEYDFL